MMSLKVISILPHTPSEIINKYPDGDDYKKRFPLTEVIQIDTPPYWVGFFRLDWHHQWSMFVKKLQPEIEMECWRPYGDTIDKKYEKEVDGLLHKVFPSSSISIKKVGELTFSKLMLEEAISEIQRNEKVIFHIYGAHSGFNTWLILNLRKYNVPIVVQHLGGWFPYFDFKKSIKNSFRLIPYFFEKRAFNYVGKYFTASVTEKAFLEKNFKNLNYEFFLNGIDFGKYPVPNKDYAKRRIGASLDKKIILYVGRLTDVKNVNILIDAYNKIKEERKDVLLYLVGGYKGEKYYNYAIKSSAIVIERSDLPIINYFAAADVYVMPIRNHGVNEFGGIGIAVLESLAMNTPVISTNLKHCLCNDEELSLLGIHDVGHYESLDNDIIQILDNPEKYKKSRKVIEKYFDINKNTRKLIKIYSELYSNHYGKVL